jgi:carboxymethylenebutenolidase
MGGRGFVLAAIAACAGGVAGAQEVRTRAVEIPGGRNDLRGYLARPRAAGAYPPVLMIHDEWGMTDWIRGRAETLAARGYVVLAIDLFRGRSTDDPFVARAFMRGLSMNQALDDLRRGIDLLLAQPGIDRSRGVGAVGWSMGGGLARALAQSTLAVGPIAICYGALTTDPAEVDRLVGKPILGIFGGRDNLVPPDRVKELGAMLAARQTPFNFKIYPNADHDFMRPNHPRFSPDDARPAWVAIEQFLSVYLHGEP